MNGVSDEKISTYYLHFIKFVGITSTVYGSISQNTSVNLVCGAKSEKISNNGSECLFWLLKCDSDTHTQKNFNKHKFLSLVSCHCTKM